MTHRAFFSKSTVTAFLVGVWISLPAAAETVDELFEKLQEAEQAEADRVAERIVGEWSKSGSAAIDLLLQRGTDALEEGEFATAVEHFTAAIDHDPGFTEAYHARATAYFLQDYYGPALDDLAHVIEANPRHFLAMNTFAVILEQLGRPEEALEVYGRVLALHPQAEEVGAAVDRLNATLDGQDI